VIGRTVFNYRLVDRLGGGGMGEIYKGEDSRLGRPVALKFVSSEIAASPLNRERFQREARIVSAINHPNICVVHDVGEYEGRPFFVMEYIHGTDLRTLINRGKVPLDRVISIGMQACDGLQAAHEQGIVHRDIKPSNIMVTDSGLVKILDFGLAKTSTPPGNCEAECPTLDSLTDSGTLVGTVAYMSPEQALGRPIDTRSDLFSLAVVLYQLATGCHPFPGTTIGAFCDALIHRVPVKPSEHAEEIPTSFDETILTALSKSADSRFQSASEFKEKLADLQTGKGGDKSAERRPHKPPAGILKRVRLRYVGLSAALLLAILVALPGGIGWFDQVLFKSTLPEKKWVAVLPFELADTAVEGYRDYCDGLARDLTIELRQLEDSGRPINVMPYRLVKGEPDMGKLLRESGVNLAVTGSLRLDGGILILYLDLIDTRTSKLLASERIESPVSERDRLAEESLQRTVRMLQLSTPPVSEGVQAGIQSRGESRIALLEAQGLLERYDDPHNVERAIEKLLRIVAENPALAGAHAALGMAYIYRYRSTGEPAWAVKAVTEARKAVQLDPASPNHLVSLGFALSEFGRHEEALQEFDRVLKLQPGSSDGLRGRAEALAALGRLDEAEAAYRSLLDLRPEWWAGYHELAKFYSNHGRYQEALRNLEKVQEILPNSTRILNNLAVVYLQNQRPSLAEEMLTQSISIEPTFDAYDLLGTAAYQQGRLAQASDFYTKALQLDPSHYEIWGNQGQILKMLGRQEQAETSFKEAVKRIRARLEVNPDDAQCKMDLADYLIELGNRAEGRSVFESALQSPALKNQPWLMALAGQIWERLGERKQAIEWVMDALDHGYPIARIRESPSLAGLARDQNFLNRLSEFEKTAAKRGSE